MQTYLVNWCFVNRLNSKRGMIIDLKFQIFLVSFCNEWRAKNGSGSFLEELNKSNNIICISEGLNTYIVYQLLLQNNLSISKALDNTIFKPWISIDCIHQTKSESKMYISNWAIEKSNFLIYKKMCI